MLELAGRSSRCIYLRLQRHSVNNPTTFIDQKENLRLQIEQIRQRELIAKREAEEARQKALQRAAELQRRRYRIFGYCTYDWLSWGMSPSGVRTVKASCDGSSKEIAIDCKRLKLSEKSWRAWSEWKTPNTGFQEDFFVEACANVLGAPEPDYVAPQPSPGESNESEQAENPRSDNQSLGSDFSLPASLQKNLEHTYRDAIRAQQEWLQRMQGR